MYKPSSSFKKEIKLIHTNNKNAQKLKKILFVRCSKLYAKPKNSLTEIKIKTVNKQIKTKMNVVLYVFVKKIF